MANCSADHVRKIPKAHQATKRKPQKWFERAVEADPADLSAILERVLLEGKKPRRASTTLQIRRITDDELEANTFASGYDLNSTNKEEMNRNRG